MTVEGSVSPSCRGISVSMWPKIWLSSVSESRPSFFSESWYVYNSKTRGIILLPTLCTQVPHY